jgi:hypothetical protein
MALAIEEETKQTGTAMEGLVSSKWPHTGDVAVCLFGPAACNYGVPPAAVFALLSCVMLAPVACILRTLTLVY